MLSSGKWSMLLITQNKKVNLYVLFGTSDKMLAIYDASSSKRLQVLTEAEGWLCNPDSKELFTSEDKNHTNGIFWLLNWKLSF